MENKLVGLKCDYLEPKASIVNKCCNCYTKRRINELIEIIRHNSSDESGGVPNVSIGLLLVLVAYIENNNRE